MEVSIRYIVHACQKIFMYSIMVLALLATYSGGHSCGARADQLTCGYAAVPETQVADASVSNPNP